MSDTNAAAPAGWYPDPSAPGRQRYWDGAQWTEHFFIPPILDLGLRVAHGLGKVKQHRIVLTDERISFDDDAIPLSAIDNVRYWQGVGGAGAMRNKLIDYVFRFTGPGTALKFSFGGLINNPLDPHHQEVYWAVVNASKAHIEPHVIGKLLDRIDAGDTVEVAHIHVSKAGLVHGRDSVSWADYRGVVIDRLHVPHVQGRAPAARPPGAPQPSQR